MYPHVSRRNWYSELKKWVLPLGSGQAEAECGLLQQANCQFTNEKYMHIKTFPHRVPLLYLGVIASIWHMHRLKKGVFPGPNTWACLRGKLGGASRVLYSENSWQSLSSGIWCLRTDGKGCCYCSGTEWITLLRALGWQEVSPVIGNHCLWRAFISKSWCPILVSTLIIT